MTWIGPVRQSCLKPISNTTGPKDVAPFHLVLIFENPNDFKMWKMTSKCIQTNANIIYKQLEKYIFLIHLNVDFYEKFMPFWKWCKKKSRFLLCNHTDCSFPSYAYVLMYWMNSPLDCWAWWVIKKIVNLLSQIIQKSWMKGHFNES